MKITLGTHLSTLPLSGWVMENRQKIALSLRTTQSMYQEKEELKKSVAATCTHKTWLVSHRGSMLPDDHSVNICSCLVHIPRPQLWALIPSVKPKMALLPAQVTRDVIRVIPPSYSYGEGGHMLGCSCWNDILALGGGETRVSALFHPNGLALWVDVIRLS